MVVYTLESVMKDICINCSFMEEMQPEHKKAGAALCCVSCWEKFCEAYIKMHDLDSAEFYGKCDA